jgi:HlyD family secretion protein
VGETKTEDPAMSLPPVSLPQVASHNSPARRRPYGRFFVFCGSLLFLVAVVMLPQGMTAPSVDSPASRYLTAEVTRGDLEVTLSQRGLLDSARNIVVTSDCEWSVRIIELVPEGTWVEEGQVVVQLDASELTERLKEREIVLIGAQADTVKAKEVLAMQELENQSTLAKSQLALSLARLDLEKYAQGDFPKAENEAKAAVALAKEDVSRARDRYEYTSRLVRKGYESPVNLEQERLSLMRYENKLANAERELNLLNDHTRRRTMTQLEAAVVNAQSELERVEKIGTIAVLNRQVQLHTRQQRLAAAQEYVDRLRKSIAACTIRAPRSGEIIYANEGSVRDEIIEGATIRNRQEVVRIPDLAQMDVKLRIHESLIEGVRQGLPATVQIDAYNGLKLAGRVVSVSRVPTTGRSRYTADLKEYDATVRIDKESASYDFLKPGLTAQVQILVNRQRDCIHVPVQSVVNLGGQNLVFVETPTGIEHRMIRIGMSSDTAVEVVDGLNESERVLLSPRTNCTEQLIALREQFSGEGSEEFSVADIGG